MEQTDEVLEKVRDYFLIKEKDAVLSCYTICGSGFMLRGQNVGLAWSGSRTGNSGIGRN